MTLQELIAALQEQSDMCLVIVVQKGKVEAEAKNLEMLIGFLSGLGKVNDAFEVQKLLRSLITERKKPGPGSGKKRGRKPNKDKDQLELPETPKSEESASTTASNP